MTDHFQDTPLDTDGDGWLGDAAAGFLFTVPVDCETVILAAGRRYAKHPLAMSNQVYEIQRGVPRILAMLAELSIPATFFIPGWTLERYPHLVEDVVGAGHELAHHSYSHRNATTLTHDEQRADFERALAVMQRFGVEPMGHRAAVFGATIQTLELLAEYGMLYDGSLMGDERPYRLQLESGAELIELPPQWATDDFEPYAFLPEPYLARNLESPQKAVSVWRTELEGARAFGGLLQLTCHAFLSGRPGRCEAVRRLLEEALDAGDVAFMTCADAARRADRDPTLERRLVTPMTVDPAVYPKP